jgi:phosphomannomutase
VIYRIKLVGITSIEVRRRGAGILLRKDMVIRRDAFKAYDIRGRVPDELNEEVVYRIGWAFAELLAAKRVVVGRDVRLSSESLTKALVRGLTDRGCSVVDIGLCGTEMVYFVTDHLGVDGGIMITASHNPMDYNGLKLVRKGARPISGDTGLRDIEEQVVTGDFTQSKCQGITKGKVEQYNVMEEYVQHLLTYVDGTTLKPLKIVVNAGNGCAGSALDALEKFLPFKFIKVYHEPDGTFPNGIPNPLLIENREATAKVVRENGADFGIAWDGDFDRCFFFDEQGEFIEGYYIVGCLAEAFLRRNTGAKIIHDPRLTWNTIEMVKEAGGIPVLCKTGHAFIKERMRMEDAIYGGEMSAHHYFRDFAYCDSGMIPWLLIADNMSAKGKPLSELVGSRVKRFPVSGEINRRVSDAQRIVAEIEKQFVVEGAVVDRTDGLSVEFAAWRFNVRLSNTEPLLRLNVESRGDIELMQLKTEELLKCIEKMG